MKSNLPAETSTSLSLGGRNFTVVTENVGGRSTKIISRVYKGEDLVSTRKFDYGSLAKGLDMAGVREILKREHMLTLQYLKEKEHKGKSTQDYINEVKKYLRNNSPKKAMGLLKEAMEVLPDNPFLLSYYGCMLSIVEKEHERGISACMRAMKFLDKKLPFGQDFFYPVFYLNLGRAFLAAGNKEQAVGYFMQGLKIDPEEPEISTELIKLGVRRKPPVSFLRRSNPVNKYIGLLLHRVK